VKSENRMLRIKLQHRIENKILYQVRLFFLLKIPWQNILQIIRKTYEQNFPTGISATWNCVFLSGTNIKSNLFFHYRMNYKMNRIHLFFHYFHYKIKLIDSDRYFL